MIVDIWVDAFFTGVLVFVAIISFLVLRFSERTGRNLLRTTSLVTLSTMEIIESIYDFSDYQPLTYYVVLTKLACALIYMLLFFNLLAEWWHVSLRPRKLPRWLVILGMSDRP